jgi:chromosome transmission fidelity protein 4
MEAENEGDELKKLESSFILQSLLTSQFQDLVDNTSASHSQRTTLAKMQTEIDKTLIQMIAAECREGEDRGMRALEMVRLLRDKSGRMVQAAGKVAERYGQNVLGEKIREVAESKLLGAEEDED